jgi:hypothetical protein
VTREHDATTLAQWRSVYAALRCNTKQWWRPQQQSLRTDAAATMAQLVLDIDDTLTYRSPYHRQKCHGARNNMHVHITVRNMQRFAAA